MSAQPEPAALVVLFTLVLARVATFFLVFPLFGSRYLPRLVKVGVCLSLTLAWLHKNLV